MRASPAQRNPYHLGIALVLRFVRTTVPVDPAHEHALVVAEGSVRVDGVVVEPGHLAYLGQGRDELAIEATDPPRTLLLGGTPFPKPILMWWYYVARARSENTAAPHAWLPAEAHFRTVPSPPAP